MQQILLEKLNKVDDLAKASKMGRFRSRPLRYSFAILYKTVVYPLWRKGYRTKTPVFWGASMQVVLPAATDIYLTGGKSHDSEIRLARFLIRHLQTGDTFLDVGAHFGYFSLLASAIVGPAGQVFAFEAAGSTFAILQQNVRKSNNINALHRAVAAKSGLVSFYEFPVLYSEYNAMNARQYVRQSWYARFRPVRREVQAQPLDHFVKEVNISPSMIKIDVEGAENQVIRGSQQLLQNTAPIIIMEYTHPDRHNAAHREALTALQTAGYQAHLIDANGNLQPCGDVEAHLVRSGLESDNAVFVKPAQ